MAARHCSLVDTSAGGSRFTGARSVLSVRWRGAPDALASQLAHLGFVVSDSLLWLEGAIVELVGAERGSFRGPERLQVVAPDAAGAKPDAGGAGRRMPAGVAVDRPIARLVALGWGTVDTERATADAGEVATPLADDLLLGARATRLGAGPVVLLEPITEGRLAAALARRGEGPIALYVAPPRGAGPWHDEPGHDGPWHGPGAGEGPFGPQVLLAGHPIHGPYLIATLP